MTRVDILKLQSSVIDGLENLKVCDLMLPEERRWDYWDLLETLLISSTRCIGSWKHSIN
jgi:hypothetical protein